MRRGGRKKTGGGADKRFSVQARPCMTQQIRGQIYKRKDGISNGRGKEDKKRMVTQLSLRFDTDQLHE